MRTESGASYPTLQCRVCSHLATAALAACLSGFNPACRIAATNGTQKLRFR
jgi:hypothetical protein